MHASQSESPETAPRRVNGKARGPESRLALVRRARRMNRRLAEAFPHVYCELDFTNPLELAVATILSAQCTDVRVNQVTPALFARYPDAARTRRRTAPSSRSTSARPASTATRPTRSSVSARPCSSGTTARFRPG